MLDLLVAALQWACVAVLALGVWFVAFCALSRDRKAQPIPARVPPRITSE